MSIEIFGRKASGKARARSSLARLALTCALATASFAAQASVPSLPVGKPRNAVDQLERMTIAFEAEDCATVIRIGAALVEPGGGLDDEGRAIAFDFLVQCELGSEARGAALAHARAGSRLDHGSEYLWRIRFAIEVDGKDYDSALATVSEMQRTRPAILNKLPARWMWQLLTTLKTAGRADLRGRLLTILTDEDYRPEELFGTNEAFRYERARLLLADGDKEGARAMLAGVRSTSSLSQASADPEMRPLLPAGFDLRAAAEAEIARDKSLMASHPDRLDPILWAAEDLRGVGRTEEALDLLKAARPRVEDPAAFSDRDEKLNWYWDQVARTYVSLGRYEDAVAAFRKGIEIGEGGTPNVSQAINLAAAQIRFGHGEEALATLKAFDDGRKTSPYGAMELALARGCALAQAGRPGEAAADVAFAREHEKDHPEALSDLLLCLGDLDGAAAAFIRRLDDPDRRAHALLQLSDYDDPPSGLPPHPVDSRLPALKARPDVKAAIERAGGLQRIGLRRGDL